MESAPAIQKLLDELERMPGVGPKSAQRIAYWLLNSPRDSALRLADAIVEVKDAVHFCSRCFNYAEGDVRGVRIGEPRCLYDMRRKRASRRVGD